MLSPKPRLLSGIKPTGRIHIGNYFGALKQFVDLQDQYETFVFIADLHALTAVPQKESLLLDTHQAVLDYLGAGIDPKKVTFFKQSAIPAHATLSWIFSNLISVPYLMRAHAFKDAEAKGREVSAGTFTYPILMAADILLYDADVVPVGQDQKQHVEYARDIAGKFNYQYKQLFKLPKERIIQDTGIVPGIDGQKMSKSHGNIIPFFIDDKTIERMIMNITTDSRSKDEEKNPDEIILYQIHKLFNSSNDLKDNYRQGLGYGDAKKLLIRDFINFITPMRERRKTYEQDPELVRTILLDGAMKANEIAMKKLTAVYEAVGLTE